MDSLTTPPGGREAVAFQKIIGLFRDNSARFLPFSILAPRFLLDVLLLAARDEDSNRHAASDSASMTCCKALVLCTSEGAEKGIENCLCSIMCLLQLGCDARSQNDDGQTARRYLEGLKKLRKEHRPMITGFQQVSTDGVSTTWADAAWSNTDGTPWLVAIGMLEQCEQSQDEGENVHKTFNHCLSRLDPKPHWVFYCDQSCSGCS